MTDDDLASASPEDSLRIALLVLANAAMDLERHILSHDGPECVLHDLRMMAKMAEAAAAGKLAPEHIARFKTFLDFRAMGESQGRG
jgi:hypothetical protein